MKFLSSPVRKNLLVSGFGLIIQILNQLLLVPLYLMVWDVNYYGDWILLTSLSSIFAMTDAGLSSVTQNQFAIEYPKGNNKICNSLLLNNLILIICVATICIVGCVFFIVEFDCISILKLHVVDTKTAGIVLLATVTSVFVKMMGNVYDSIYRANSKLYIAITITQVNVLLNVIVIVCSLFLFHSMIYVALFVLIVDFSVLVYRALRTRNLFEFSFNLKYLDMGLFKKLLLPSLSFMSFPISNAIIYQGFTFLVNKYFGAASMVEYNTIRTLTSFVKKVVSMIQTSVWPEYSLAYGKNDTMRMRDLHRKAFSLSFPITIFSCICILVGGKYIYEVWTAGKIVFNYSLVFSFCLLLIARNVWTTSSVALLATNKHVRYSTYYLIGSIFSLVISVLLEQKVHYLEMFVYSQLFIDIFLCSYVLNKAMVLTKDHLSDFFYSPIKLLFNKARIIK